MSRKSTRKRQKKTDEEFLSWEDFDSDCDTVCDSVNLPVDPELLDGNAESTTTTTECAEAGVSDTSVVHSFRCPEEGCKKTYKTISGFRTHMLKVHNIANKPACENQSSQTCCQTPFWVRATFDEVKERCTQQAQQALQAIIDDSLLGFGDGKHVRGVAQLLVSRQEILLPVAELMFPVIQSMGTDSNSSADREALCAGHYQVAARLDSEESVQICGKSICDVIPTATPDIVHQFFQVFLREFIDSALSSMTTKSSTSEEENIQLSDIDQNVICYVAGYILHALKKRYSRFSSGKIFLDVISDIQRKPSGTESRKFSKWVQKTSRGGLTLPPEHFFFVLRHCEMLCRKAPSLNTLVLTETILTSFMVKHNWTRLVSKTSVSEVVLEHCVRLFLKVRGHAFAKLKKRSLVMDKNKALRKVLKDKANLK